MTNDSKDALNYATKALKRFSQYAEQDVKLFTKFLKTLKEQLMPKVTIKSVNYEKCEVKIENDGVIIELSFIRKDIPTICKQLLKAVALMVVPEEIAPGLSAITAYASKEVYAALTKEYLIAPGRKLITMFANNGVEIRAL